MWRGFFSSARYFAMPASERSRPNQVVYQVKNGTMMKSAARMISGQVERLRVRGGGVATWPLPLLTYSFIGSIPSPKGRGRNSNVRAKDKSDTASSKQSRP